MKIKLMRLIYSQFLCFLFIAMGSVFVFALEKPPVELNGKVTSLKLGRENNTHISFDVTIEMEFINKGDCPILLSKLEPWEFSKYIALSVENLLNRKYIYSSGGGVANDISPRWGKYRQKLDKLYPSKKHFRYVLPNDVWRFEVETVIEITKVVGNIGDDFIVDGSWNKIDWLQIKSSPELWLQLNINFWYSNIEPVEYREEKRFGNKLRNQWGKYGYLWLDEVESKPISLDFNVATIKNGSKY